MVEWESDLKILARKQWSRLGALSRLARAIEVMIPTVGKVSALMLKAAVTALDKERKVTQAEYIEARQRYLDAHPDEAAKYYANAKRKQRRTHKKGGDTNETH